MPPSSACLVCCLPTNKLCSRCNLAAYCSESCQKLAWTKGHAKECVAMDRLAIGALKGEITSDDKTDPENMIVTLPLETRVIFIQEDRGEGRIKTKQAGGVAFIKFNRNKTSAMQLIAALKKIAVKEGQELPEEKKKEKKKEKKDKKGKKDKKDKKHKKHKKHASRSKSPKRDELPPTPAPAPASATMPPETLYQSLMAASSEGSGSSDSEGGEASGADPEEWVDGEDGMSVNDLETGLSDAVDVFMKTHNLTNRTAVSPERLVALTTQFRSWIERDKNFDPMSKYYLDRYQGRRNLVRESVEGFFVTEEPKKGGSKHSEGGPSEGGSDESNSDLIHMSNGTRIKIRSIIDHIRFEVLPKYLIGMMNGGVTDEEKLVVYRKVRALYKAREIPWINAAYWAAIDSYEKQQEAGFGRDFLEEAWEELWEAEEEK